MKFTAVLSIALLVAIVPFAIAQTTPVDAPPAAGLSPFSLGAHLSYWNARDLNDFTLNGMLGGGVVGQFRFNPHVALELRLSGFGASDSQDYFIEGKGWYETDLTVVAMPMEAGLVAFLPLTDTFELYGGPGVGFYLFDGEYTVEQGPWKATYDIDLDDKGGVYLLLGVRAKLASNMALYAEAKYTWVKSKLDTLIPPSDYMGTMASDRNIDFSGVSINAGLSFTF